MKKRNIVLFLLFAAMITVMCQCSSTKPTLTHLPNGLTCIGGNVIADSGREIFIERCDFPCADGQIQKLIVYEDRVLSEEELNAKYCTAIVTPTPTIVALAEPAMPTPEKSFDPMLTGDVTLCDLKNKVINLRIVDGYDASQFSSLDAAIAGQPMTCGVNPSNASIFTCSLPMPLTFPAQITLQGDGHPLNEFSFDGSSCISDERPHGDGDPNQPPATPDCLNDPTNPGC